MQRREKIPPNIIALANDAQQPDCYFEEARYGLFRIIVDVCDLRNAETLGNLNPTELVEMASDVDRKLVSWVSSLPECLNFKIIIDVTGSSLDGYYHSYTNCSDARLWGFYRCARILVNEVITRAIPNLPLLSSIILPGNVLSSTSVVSELCGDICASIPYFILSSRNEVADVNGKNFTWPLYVVATSSVVTVDTRCWVINQLQNISKKSATLQGIALAKVLNTTWEITDWRSDALGKVEEV